MNKSFYFRKSSTLTDDDDNDNSLIVPVNKVFYMIASSSIVSMYFKGLVDNPEEHDVAPNGVALTITTGRAKTVLQDIANAVDNGEESIVTIFDAVTGDKVSSDITSVALISINET
tara:strand:- start:1128 stop:1475 length:348 start_codon:yes stop_codon:yes gene_type:complete